MEEILEAVRLSYFQTSAVATLVQRFREIDVPDQAVSIDPLPFQCQY